jgi:uncharacterized membrane protein YkoI
MSQRIFRLLLLATAGLAAVGVLAGDDHDEARRLRRDDEILPLETIVERAGLGADSRILEVETEFEHGRRVYEIEYVTAGGRIMEVVVDARSGEVLDREAH